MQEFTFQEIVAQVAAFHNAFGIENKSTPTADIPAQTAELRHRLMQEENEEYLQAALAGNVVEVADALGDMLYILCGTLLAHGMQHKIEEVFAEIQRSNMSKLDEKGKPIYREDGKVMKSKLYSPPNISKILKA